MTLQSSTALKQRADYTHKPNLKTGRHGWLRLTPAYSVKVVEELIASRTDPCKVLDPFCGTATTALSAAYHGHNATTIDINDFLVWFGIAKTRFYSETDLAIARALSMSVQKRRRQVEPAPIPKIHNIDRWWSPATVNFLRSLKGAIQAVTEVGSPAEALLLIAFCRTLIGTSNAAFNHQSMSFKSEALLPLLTDGDLDAQFARNVQFVLSGAEDNPRGSALIVRDDARDLRTLVEAKFDIVITSPPYANRMSYIRELRPYMYWLDFLNTGREAGELDWSAIGGTWGMATSRLTAWQARDGGFRSETLARAVRAIAASEAKNASLLANYVAKYFEDMWQHLCALAAVLADDAEVHYIVGNSTFYGVLLPVEVIYAEMLAQLGFERVEHRALRKRNSKKELIEFDVNARWRTSR